MFLLASANKHSSQIHSYHINVRFPVRLAVSLILAGKIKFESLFNFRLTALSFSGHHSRTIISALET